MNLNGFKKLGLKNKLIISIAGFIMVLISIIYFMVLPTINDIKEMGRKIESEKMDLEEKYQKGQSLKRLAEDIRKIEPLIEKLDQIYINKNDSLELITTLEKIANKNNINQKINLVDAQNTENQYYQKMPIQLSTNGSFINQMKYLTNLESSKYYINIQSLEISPTIQNSNSTETNSIKMLIFADTYWR